MSFPSELARKFISLLHTIPGSPERDRLLALLAQARPFVLQKDVASAASYLIETTPKVVENNLDFLGDLEDEGVLWIEWDEADRGTDLEFILDDKVHPEKVGVLLFPNEEGIIMGTIAWMREDDKIDHVPAFFVLSLNDLKKAAFMSQRFYSSQPKEVQARLLSLVGAGVPQNFIEEIDILQGIQDENTSTDDYVLRACQEASAEAIYILAALLLMKTPQAVVTDTKVSFEQEKPRNRIFEFFRKPRSGLTRYAVNPGADGLSWHQPS